MTKIQEKIYTILGGRVKMADAGYKATSDALLLAAAVDARRAKTILDAGVGTGAVLLSVLDGTPRICATGLDISAESLELCAKNAELNGRDVKLIAADITKWRTNRQFDLVVSNPPFFKGAGRAEHHCADLSDWTKGCAKRVAPHGRIYMIVEPGRLPEVIKAMPAAFGDITIKPIFTNKDAAERVIISARLGTRDPCRIIK
ncbi:MAG: methyltransferase [Rickettsiales bacterium]|jgi:tRNA1(Val) A37 N6-methylase TrmN6|nr:methyltransferase [Rickettsiales bacterium]